MNSGQAYSAKGTDTAGQRSQVMVAAEGICRSFGGGHTAVRALRGVSFTIDHGQLVALRGRSGSGKTTLLNIIGGLDDPTEGRVWVDGREVNRMSERERLAMRRDRIAFIFQAFGLVPMLSAAENVGIPLRIAGMRPSERRERVAAGAVWVAGHNLGAMTAKERLAYRRSVAGFIWQQTSRNLLPYMTARQNVLLPMRLSSLGRRERLRRAALLLDTLGIAYCADRTPDRMSGGEQQRAAIATALANQPKVLLADEPTGELDSSTAQDVFSALQTANTELGVTVLVVTHDPAVSSKVRRTIAIRDGKTSSETIRHAATDELGETTLHAREYATLDRAGRVQLPRDTIRRLGMRNRVELQEEPDHIGVWPDQAPNQEQE
jgi:ABC-type lipoprotein export system ATPase subunit